MKKFRMNDDYTFMSSYGDILVINHISKDDIWTIKENTFSVDRVLVMCGSLTFNISKKDFDKYFVEVDDDETSNSN